MRTQATNDFHKSLFKLNSNINAIYGKSIQNIKQMRHIKSVSRNII